MSPLYFLLSLVLMIALLGMSAALIIFFITRDS